MRTIPDTDLCSIALTFSLLLRLRFGRDEYILDGVVLYYGSIFRIIYMLYELAM
jgi:hypothetical protein